MTLKVGIFGLGKSGVASAIYFRNRGFDVYVWDDSEKSVEAYDVINTIVVPPEKWPWGELESLVLAPGIPLTHPAPHPVVEIAKRYKVEVICDIEVLMRDAYKGAKFIGITGTNGKSTTTALINHVLKECGVDVQMGGNIGIAALSLNPNRESVFVLEVSSYQIDLLDKAAFDVAVLLNISPDHIDRYGNMENYVESKKRIFRNQNEDGMAIICVDQPVTANIAKQLATEDDASMITYITGGHILRGEEFNNLPGEHNRQNIIAAYLAAKCFVQDEQKILAAIRSFGGLAHRMEKVFESAEVVFINDSKATNAEAAAPALKTYNNIYWLAGGVPKDGGINILEEYKDKVAHAFFFGQAAPMFEKSYKGWKLKNYTKRDTMADAFTAAANMALEDAKESGKRSVVMLSPACASFDEFRNYEHRGDTFRRMATEYAEDKGL